MSNVYVLAYKYCVHPGDSDQPFEDGPYSGYRHDVRSGHKFTLFRKPEDYKDNYYFYELDKFDNWEEVETTEDLELGSKAIAVIQLYGDGGTFERTDGYVDFIGISKPGKEQALVNQAARKDYGYFGSKDELLTEILEVNTLTPKVTKKETPRPQTKRHRRSR